MAKRFLEINPKFQAWLRTLPDDLTDELKDTIAHQADLLATQMKRELNARGAVRTGQLIASIGVAPAADGTYIKDGLAVEVGAGFKNRGKKRRRNRMLAKFMEHGTRHHSARPFVRPAFEIRKAKILAALKEATDRVIQQTRGR
ncbi:HK97 gp10 family phage protein (plasmid) [Skermanella sp. TT6]|uniref:HK97 gp10 family phage protein n=1 Tax=Skermanella cutis TaxID=2775420 RepID=A0ABX7BGS5_9PROT|nr:HK97-gp10 family putative phage morphogenesis protein [Skermanella sp. TT6]QQP93562.1 HK97 gp10 family phage protein [Skermanella sp. TT6]